MARAGTASRARIWRRIAIGLVVLLVVLIAADRGGDWAAERAAADTLRDSQHLSNRPNIDITGFPFLTQLAAGDFDKITISASDVPVGSQLVTLNVADVHVVLNNVHVSRDFSSVSADTASATALVGYDDLSKSLGARITYQGDGRVKADKQLTVAGVTVGGTITARPRIRNNSLSFGKTAINDIDHVSGQVAQLLHKIFDVSVPLQGIPFDIRVTSLTADAQGLHFRLTGANLHYSH